jgi:hypothetical protein
MRVGRPNTMSSSIHTFTCVSCGDIDVSLVHYETDGTEAICTLCGSVSPQCPWTPTPTTTEYRCRNTEEHLRATIPTIVRQIVTDLGLEPVDEWALRILRSVTHKCSAQSVCSRIASLFEEDNRSLTSLLDYANAVHHVSFEKIIGRDNHHHHTVQDVYMPMITRLSERVSMDHVTKRSLHKQVLGAVRRVPALEFRLPNSVVVAVWWKGFGATGCCCSEDVSSVCNWMNIKFPTIKRLLPLI